MEAYFHSDPRLEEWVNQITEKIFAVCLLTGVESEAEFQKGCQIVTKIAHLLQEITIIPAEYLEDGLKQLLEQQLPDSQAIADFPTFQTTMNNMLREGLNRALTNQSEEPIKILSSTKISIPVENTKENALQDSMILCDGETGRSMNVNNGDLSAEQAIISLASVNRAELCIGEVKVELPVASIVDKAKPYGIIRKMQVPEQADRLKHVLSNIFPNVEVTWNLNLMGQTFLAQVKDILIYLYNPEHPCQVEKLNKEGWKVYMCSSEDLLFPRRLERGIRQCQRMVSIVSKI